MPDPKSPSPEMVPRDPAGGGSEMSDEKARRTFFGAARAELGLPERRSRYVPRDWKDTLAEAVDEANRIMNECMPTKTGMYYLRGAHMALLTEAAEAQLGTRRKGRKRA